MSETNGAPMLARVSLVLELPDGMKNGELNKILRRDLREPVVLWRVNQITRLKQERKGGPRIEFIPEMVAEIERCIAAGLSQRVTAHRIGVGLNTYTRWLKARRQQL